MQQWMTTWGPVVAALIGGAFTLLGVYLEAPKEGRSRSRSAIPFFSLLFFSISAFAIYQLWEPKDQWDIWSDKIANSIDNCPKQEGSYCVQNALEKQIKNMPPVREPNNTAELFYHDMRAGEALLRIEQIRKSFDKYFGIKSDTFIGSGATVPWVEGAEYKNAQAREYLIPNFPETNKFVWTWRLSPEQVVARGMTVENLIENMAPDESSNREYDISNIKQTLKERMYDPSEQPPVIRFQQFSEKKYQGTMGRPEALRVFAVSLADVYNMKLQHAVRASGFTYDEDNAHQSDTRLFIWIYIPFHNKEVVPATWGNVISKASEWLKNGSPK